MNTHNPQTLIHRGGGTGPADPAAAGPIIYSEITRTKNYHKNIFNLMYIAIVYAHNYPFMFTDLFYMS